MISGIFPTFTIKPFKWEIRTCHSLIVIFLPFIFLWLAVPVLGQTVNGTYETSDIPTNLGSYSSSCNGPLTVISVTLPAGSSWTVTGIDIVYNMTAQGAGAFKSHQRSYIRCQNTATSEGTVYQGTGDTGGIQMYNRPGVDIANGPYAGGTILRFEMRAWRTLIGMGCSTANNKVDNYTWIITVHYGAIPDEGSVGIGTTSPATSAILDLTSTTQAFLPPRMTTPQRNAIAAPVPGMIIFNTSTQNLEIFTSGWGSISFSSPAIKKLLGGSGNDTPFSIQQTSDGGYVVAGTTNSSNTGTLMGLTNNGGFDIWIVRLDETGAIIWQKLLGGNDHEGVNSIQQTNDGGFILAGGSSSSNTGTLSGLTNNGGADQWIVRLNANGVIVWQFLYGGLGDEFAQSIQKISGGGYIVSGYSSSSNTGTLAGLTNFGLNDYWIYKLDENGAIVWQYLFGDTQNDEAYSITESTDQGFIIAGRSNSSNTGTLLGLNNNGPGGTADYWILKLSSTGAIIWQRLFGGDDDDIPYTIDNTLDGGALVGGYSRSASNTGTLTGLTNNGEADYLIMRLDESGNVVWQKLLGGLYDEICWSVEQTKDAGFIAVGFSGSSNTGTLTGLTSNGQDDYWVIKFDGNGLIDWQKLLGGSLSDYGFSVHQTTDSAFIIAGRAYSSNTGNLAGLINNGSGDYWLIKLDKSGNP